MEDWGRAMAQAVSRRSLTAVARVRTRVNPVGFVVDKVALGGFFSESFGFPLSVSFHRGLHISEQKKNIFFTHPFIHFIHPFTHSLFILIRGRRVKAAAVQ
jgi:hypothetical protein